MPANLDSMRAAVNIDASVTGKSNVAGLTGALAAANAETAKLTKQQPAMAKSLQYTTDTLHMSKSELLAYKAEAIGMGTTLNPVIANLKQMGIDGEHSFKGMIQSGGVFRELLVLLHETLIMGNFSRAGGSLMVLAERTGASAALFTLLGGALVATAGGMAAFVAALIMGERESTRFANAISLTGGMAGITEGQFRVMAAAIGQDVPDGVVKGRNALLDLIATGQFSGATLEAVGRAATEMASYTGESAADVVKNFDDMKGNAAAWAEKMNNSYHFLSEAQYEYIQQLELQGQTEKAEQVAANDLFQSLADNGTHNLGILERAWMGVASAVRDTFSAMEDVGRATTPDQQLAARIALDQSGSRGGRNIGGVVRAVTDPNTDPVVIALRAQIIQQQNAASGKAASDQVQQLGISAKDSLGDLTKGLLPGPDEIATFATTLKQKVDEVLAADPTSKYGLMLQKMEPALIAKYAKEHADNSGGAALNKPDTNGYDIGSDDTGKMSTQLSLMQSWAKATKESEVATLALAVAQGKLNGFSVVQIAELKECAIRDDALTAAGIRQAAADKAASDANAAQGKYADMMGGYSDKDADLRQQIAQMTDYGKVTKQAELNALNLQIPQGKLDGFPQSEIDSLRKVATETDDLQAKLTAYSRTGAAGTQAAFKDYVDNATDAGAQMKEIWTQTFSGMEDILINALEGGKFSFRAFTLEIVNDMLKMELEERILGPLLSSLGNFSGASSGSGIFGSLLGAVGSGFGSAGAMSTASLIERQGGSSSVLSGIGSFLSSEFADGGIMTSRGGLSLNKYANGGIANSPQMAVFGEGRMPEAYVPLPDGRSIPVSMKGSGGGNITNHFTINSDGSSGDGDNEKNANAMNRALLFTIRSELIKQHRDGGIFSTTSRAK